MRFDGKVALVAGSSRNLGKAVAYGFGKEGGSVIINAHSAADELQETAREFRDEGIKVLAVLADITDQAQVKDMVRKGTEAFGTIDCLVMSARVAVSRRPFLETTAEDWLAMQANALATLYLLQAVIPGMLEKGDGRILTIGGNLGPQMSGRQAGWPGIGATSGAMAPFTAGNRADILRYVQRNYGPQIRVNGISPGNMDTSRDPRNYPHDPGGMPQFNPERLKEIPLGRAGQSVELANVALFLLSDEASYVNGVDVDVNGGLLM